MLALLPKSFLSLSLLAAASTAAPLAPRDTTFSLTDIIFVEGYGWSAPPHVARYNSTVSFTLTNTALGRTTYCHATGIANDPSSMVFNGEISFDCDSKVSSFKYTANGPIVVTDDTYAISSFVSAHGVDIDSGVTGSGTPDFTDTFSSWINPTWTISNGELFSVTSNTHKAPELDIIAS